jgi:glycosyltransferase involved in cell wall biosynthesis
LRVGIEISPLLMRMSGMPNYLLGLLRGLAAVDDRNEYLLYTNRPLTIDLDLPERFKVRIVNRPIPWLQAWFQLALPHRLLQDEVDIYHAPWHRFPLYLPVPSVLTVHDLSGYLMPGIHTLQTRIHNFMMPSYLRRAKQIIAVSGFTAAEIRRHFPETAGRVTVVHEAASPLYHRVVDPDVLSRTLKRYGLPQRFILYLGALEPRKNVVGLLKAYKSIAGSVDQVLVLAGSRSWKYEPILDLLKQSPLRERVMLAGSFNKDDVPTLLSLADFLAWPSLYEGFGLPVIEAMACGTPVLTSKDSAMSEVSGDAALLVDPQSVEEIAAGLENLCRDETLRSQLSTRGLERASHFSWEKTALETLAVYRKVLES